MQYPNARNKSVGAYATPAAPTVKINRNNAVPGAAPAAERILKKYTPFFEQARRACQAHLLAGNHAGIVREVTLMCSLDDALVSDLCLATDKSLQQAQTFRNIRRDDIELLRTAARCTGNTAASLRAEQLLRNVRERSLLALSDLRKSSATVEAYDERFRDYGSVVADLDEIAPLPTPTWRERRKK
jgi:hypothetical protein